MAMTLYDLAGAEPERRFSPFCWKTKLALAHKALPVETVPWRFTDRDAIAFSGQGRVPVLVDDGKTVFDSWTIATYLEDKYHAAPSLFGGAAAIPVTRFLNAWSDTVILPALAKLIVADIWSHIAEKDKEYFRTSREQRFGAKLEAVQANRDKDVVAFRQLFAPVRTTLAAQPYLGGSGPIYADYIVAGFFLWARAISSFQLLEKDDPVAAWRSRMLDACGGLGRKSPGYDV